MHRLALKHRIKLNCQPYLYDAVIFDFYTNSDFIEYSIMVFLTKLGCNFYIFRSNMQY